MRNRMRPQNSNYGFLAEALLEIREMVSSGSEEMGVIDDALSQAGIRPWKTNPECLSRKNICMETEFCIHCRRCGGNEADPDGICEICLRCALCCECRSDRVAPWKRSEG